MKSRSNVDLGFLVISLAFWLSGCGGSTTTPSPAPDAGDQGSGTMADMDHEGEEDAAHDEGATSDDAAEIAAALAELSDEDRALAEKQKICPVSGHPLGSMGKPIKLDDINGQTVFICCEGCESKLRDDPETYLAKLKEQESENSGGSEGTN